MQIEIILLFTHTLKIIENDALTVLISVLGPSEIMAVVVLAIIIVIVWGLP